MTSRGGHCGIHKQLNGLGVKVRPNMEINSLRRVIPVFSQNEGLVMFKGLLILAL